MKKLTNLNDLIKSLNDLPIAGMDGKALTYKSALVSCCEMFKPTTPGTGEMLRAFDLGMNIQKNDELEISEEDIDFLIKMISNNPIFITVVTGRIIRYLEDIKTSNVNK